MDELERRLTAAMNARADLVTEESFTVEAPPVATRRWPVLVAAAASVLVVAGVIAASSWHRAEPPADPTPPPAVTSTEPPPSAPSGEAPPEAGGSATRNSATGTITGEEPTCGPEPCQLEQEVDLDGDTVQVWADEWGRGWHVRVDGVVVADRPEFEGALVREPLRCAVVADRPVCLVYTYAPVGTTTAAGLEKVGGDWRFTGVRFDTAFGTDLIEPRDVYADGSIEVVSMESRNGIDGWTTQVWRWDGSRLGCSAPVATREELPGWPTFAPDVPPLTIANCLSR